MTIDIETIIFPIATIAGSSVVSSLTNWAIQRHFLSKLEN